MAAWSNARPSFAGLDVGDRMQGGPGGVRPGDDPRHLAEHREVRHGDDVHARVASGIAVGAELLEELRAVDTGLLVQLPERGLVERLLGPLESAGNRPPALEGRDAASHEEHAEPPLVHGQDDDVDGDGEGREGGRVVGRIASCGRHDSYRSRWLWSCRHKHVSRSWHDGILRQSENESEERGDAVALRALLTGVVVVAAALVAGAAGAQQAAAPPPGAQISSSLEYVTRVPGTSMVVEGKFDKVRGRDLLIITGRFGFKTLDVSDPTDPQVLDTFQPAEILGENGYWQDEDMDIDRSRNLIIGALDPRHDNVDQTSCPGIGTLGTKTRNPLCRSGFYVISYADPENLEQVGDFVDLPAGHTVSCIDGCKYVWTGGTCSPQRPDRTRAVHPRRAR